MSPPRLKTTQGSFQMRSLTKTDAAFEALRKEIYAGKLKPGQRLPVSELMARLDMSPTPIREALRLLQAAGLVVHEPHHGVVVRTYSGDQDREIHDLRAVLEPLAAEKAASSATAEQLATIERYYKQMRALTTSPSRTRGELEKIAASHTALFRSLFEASNSELLVNLLSQLRAGQPVGRPMPQWEETLDEQAEIVAAIRDRDGARAHTAMAAYLAHVRELAFDLAEKISGARANSIS